MGDFVLINATNKLSYRQVRVCMAPSFLPYIHEGDGYYYIPKLLEAALATVARPAARPKNILRIFTCKIL